MILLDDDTTIRGAASQAVSVQVEESRGLLGLICADGEDTVSGRLVREVPGIKLHLVSLCKYKEQIVLALKHFGVDLYHVVSP